MRQNELINRTYLITDQIGQGGTGVVYRAWHINLRKYVVLKKINLPSMDTEALRRETDILKNLHHEGLPQVYDFFIDNGNVFTVMDYIEGTDLNHIRCGIRYLSEERLGRWLCQIAGILSYLHSRREKVIHSDIKPGNVILTPEDTLCLIDFNISVSGRTYGKIQGYSENFAAPEQIQIARQIMNGQRPGLTLNESADIYSTGALFYFLMTGVLPSSVSLNTPLSPQNCGYSEEICRIVNRCMIWNRAKRYQNGLQLRKASENMKRHTAAYRRLICLQAGIWVISSCLTAAGIFCLIHGRKLQILENLQGEYNDFVTSFNNGEYEEAEERGVRILNSEKYRSILADDVQQKSEILHALGDIRFQEEDYQTAAEYYGEAGTENEAYLTDYALALARSGQTGKAENLISSLQQTDEEGTLVRAAISMQNGNYEEAEKLLRPLMGSEKANIAASAYSLAADGARMQGDLKTAISMLEQEQQISGSILVQRKLGEMYMEAASDSRMTSSQKTYYAEKALKRYEEICSSMAAEKTDRLNYVSVLQYLGRAEESIRVLSDMRKTDPEDYRVNMYLAFAYQMTGNMTDAVNSAREALKEYEANPHIGNEDQGAIEKMEALAKGQVIS